MTYCTLFFINLLYENRYITASLQPWKVEILNFYPRGFFFSFLFSRVCVCVLECLLWLAHLCLRFLHYVTIQLFWTDIYIYLIIVDQKTVSFQFCDLFLFFFFYSFLFHFHPSRFSPENFLNLLSRWNKCIIKKFVWFSRMGSQIQELDLDFSLFFSSCCQISFKYIF